MLILTNLIAMVFINYVYAMEFATNDDSFLPQDGKYVVVELPKDNFYSSLASSHGTPVVLSQDFDSIRNKYVASGLIFKNSTVFDVNGKTYIAAKYIGQKHDRIAIKAEWETRLITKVDANVTGGAHHGTAHFGNRVARFGNEFFVNPESVVQNTPENASIFEEARKQNIFRLRTSAIKRLKGFKSKAGLVTAGVAALGAAVGSADLVTDAQAAATTTDSLEFIDPTVGQ